MYDFSCFMFFVVYVCFSCLVFVLDYILLISARIFVPLITLRKVKLIILQPNHWFNQLYLTWKFKWILFLEILSFWRFSLIFAPKRRKRFKKTKQMPLLTRLMLSLPDDPKHLSRWDGAKNAPYCHSSFATYKCDHF